MGGRPDRGLDDDGRPGLLPDSRTGALLGWLGRDRIDTGLVLLLLLIIASLVFVVRGVREPRHEFVAMGAAGLVVARGLVRGRRILVPHAVGALLILAIARFADMKGHPGTAWLATFGAGAALVLPERSEEPAAAEERRHVWALVDRTTGDSLAPFALRTDKSYVMSRDRLAAVAYRVRFGTAVASGDPVGDPWSRAEAIDEFVEHARSHGWRVAVIGAGEQVAQIWRDRGLWGLDIGREVLIDVEAFSLAGRKFRNLRQAVQRSRNAGVTTEIVAEASLPDGVREELANVARKAHRPLPPRGFAMILDHPLTGVHPGTYIAIARDRAGNAVGFQRFASADAGRELSLDLPFRDPAAPNGVDERLAVDMVDWAREHGARRISLAFAPFPEVFDNEGAGVRLWLARRAVHRLDPFIHLESLYRYLRKFHAFGPRRFVLLRPREVVAVLVALLSLEFSRPRPERRRGPVRRAFRRVTRMRGDAD
ncbi:MAG: bifunctional lysylphosphatidylglycerol flippase/synthetase MprF [Actinomycetes bacterium]